MRRAKANELAARTGVPVGCFSIPIATVHSPSEMVDFSDVQNSVKLLTAASQYKDRSGIMPRLLRLLSFILDRRSAQDVRPLRDFFSTPFACASIQPDVHFRYLIAYITPEPLGHTHASN